MRVVFMGKSKRSVVRALDLIMDRGTEVIAVVAAEPEPWARETQRLDLAARRHGLSLLPEAELYAVPPDDVDLVVSFLYPRLIRQPVLSLGRIGCLNFHPAPLPDFRGVGGYNVAVLEELREWGVSCHFVDEHFDTGDLVEVERFAIDPDAHTAFSLDIETGNHLVGLFGRVIDRVLAGKELPRAPQGEGRYVSGEDMERFRVVRPRDDVERKLRAFWYPPYPGALIEVEGRPFTLVGDAVLAEIGDAYRDAGRLP